MNNLLEKYQKTTWPIGMHHPKYILAHYFNEILYKKLDPQRFVVQVSIPSVNFTISAQVKNFIVI